MILCGCLAAAGYRVHRDGGEQDGGGPHGLRRGPEAEQLQAVVDHGHDDPPQDRPQHLAAPAEQPAPPDAPPRHPIQHTPPRAAPYPRVRRRGGAAALVARRGPARTTTSPPASPPGAAMTTQPAVTLIAPLSMSDRTLLYSLMVPPEPGAASLMMNSRKPWPNRYPASVTTKDGSRSQVTITPWIPL